ncbi:MAG TPA: Uma2 family endonuclease [Phycisphaerae bacterium]|nr:Uma2 family endonuclease [Phycisphaerae bacterium]
MTTALKLVTAEELLAIGNRLLELYEGELRTVSPANFRHGQIAVQIALLLKQYVKAKKLGAVVVEVGFVLARNPDTVLGPDVAFISKSRVPGEDHREKFVEGHPDLAVEIISPSNPRREREENLKTYLRYGTPLGWLVDPAAETVEIYRPGTSVQRLAKAEMISFGDVIPGFSCAVADFFDV